ncbi:MAG: DUF1580 domain-containing protein [Planctomycetes bacterium]|jgi:hypothetical protein|nr:DUF1580 domain-containing protein [Planctomycetota bacterium]
MTWAMVTREVSTSITSSQTAAERLLDEGVLTIVEAARWEGIDISSKTALRWALAGTGGAKLESIRIGGRRMTSRAAMRRFVAAQQQDRRREPAAIGREAADRVLAAHGLPRGAGRD